MISARREEIATELEAIEAERLTLAETDEADGKGPVEVSDEVAETAREATTRTRNELDTVERISTRVMILRGGHVVADDSASKLRELMHAPSLEDVFAQLAVHDDVERVAEGIVATVRL